jgi:hypothetical protein
MHFCKINLLHLIAIYFNALSFSIKINVKCKLLKIFNDGYWQANPASILSTAGL